ncbi:hypothetical protein EZI54_11360 [Marinobacter halodurans]|uniref:Trypsin-co-occurring domain-containing protein n=1 Tax=Marinobacter halodurans TaxID=2528979 RepID=A0ABY1ZK49_9GAMM|nr:CU044_2847 family protein [Marinobacter halodurans]TBW55759.1 hypothetical protein EZI54_11360 [Marinobacter halodurans]
MPERRFLEHGNAAIHIETSSSTDGHTAAGARFLKTIQDLSKLIGKGLAELESDAPDSVSIRFRLGLSDDGNFVIALDGTPANFEVEMNWGGGSTPDIPLPRQK